jgi:hypothetical protein
MDQLDTHNPWIVGLPKAQPNLLWLQVSQDNVALRLGVFVIISVRLVSYGGIA